MNFPFIFELVWGAWGIVLEVSNDGSNLGEGEIKRRESHSVFGADAAGVNSSLYNFVTKWRACGGSLNLYPSAKKTIYFPALFLLG